METRLAQIKNYRMYIKEQAKDQVISIKRDNRQLKEKNSYARPPPKPN